MSAWRRVSAERLARVVLVAACVWFAFTILWGMGGIPASGHLGAGSAGTFMASEQMIRWRILYPARSWYSSVRPEGAALMCHHPYGQYYVPALLYALFGHHDALLHVPVILPSLAIPLLLYGLAKERGGAPLGAVAAAAYVVVPIAVGFSTYWNLETICIFGALLFFWGHSRHMATGRARYLAASLFGACVVCSGDWVGFLLVAPTLAWAFLRAFVLPARLTPRVRLAPYARWWALSVAIAVVLLAWWVGLFAHAGQISQWLGAEQYRGGGGFDGLSAVLRARKGWIDFSFTPLAIAIGKVAAPVCVAQFIVRRRDEDTYALGMLFGACVQYVAFKGGADVHIFWPHYFAAYFAMSLAQLCEVVSAALVWIARRFRPTPARAAGAIALALGLVPVAAMAHDGVKSLWVWRRTGGRFDEHGHAIRSEVDLMYVIKDVIVPRTRRGMSIDTPRSLGWGWESLWQYQGTANTEAAPSVGRDVRNHPFWLARASGLSAAEQRRIAAASHVRVYGDAWVVDQRERAAPLDAYSLNEREPNALEWLFYGGTEPMRSIGARPDPWLTWEWRVHLGQPADPPRGEPRTLDEVRVAYDAAIAAGDHEAAARWRARIDAAIDHRTAADFTRGVRLLGTRLVGGVQPRVQCWFELVGGAPFGDAYFDVRSSLVAREAFSLLPPDKTDRDMSFPPPLPASLWRHGFVYVSETVLNHRIGRERYSGEWRARDGGPAPRRVDGQPSTVVAELP